MDGRPRDRIDRARACRARPVGPATGSVGRTVRGAAGALVLWKLLVAAGFGTVAFGIGLVLAIAVPGAVPIGLLLMLVGPLAPALTWWSMSEPSRRRGPW